MAFFFLSLPDHVLNRPGDIYIFLTRRVRGRVSLAYRAYGPSPDVQIILPREGMEKPGRHHYLHIYVATDKAIISSTLKV